jgi:hypothetical protein
MIVTAKLSNGCVARSTGQPPLSSQVCDPAQPQSPRNWMESEEFAVQLGILAIQSLNLPFT